MEQLTATRSRASSGPTLRFAPTGAQSIIRATAEPTPFDRSTPFLIGCAGRLAKCERSPQLCKSFPPTAEGGREVSHPPRGPSHSPHSSSVGRIGRRPTQRPLRIDAGNDSPPNRLGRASGRSDVAWAISSPPSSLGGSTWPSFMNTEYVHSTSILCEYFPPRTRVDNRAGQVASTGFAYSAQVL